MNSCLKQNPDTALKLHEHKTSQEPKQVKIILFMTDLFML